MGRRAEANINAEREGYRKCTRQRATPADVPLDAEFHPARRTTQRRIPPVFPISSGSSLLNHTGSWSDERPVLTAACTACALCALFCPEGAIARGSGSMAVDFLYCKGCGICQVVCPVRDAIHMQEVKA
jgi:pyruvate ferredoxin oxidoreductase delta subunit